MARMRLLRRSRPERELPGDWVQPRRSGRWTDIGNLDSPARAAVDPAGLVTVDRRGWSLDWWIGAEDRWHLPCREVAVRQTLMGISPVVETRVKVPSGDAVHRAYAARNRSGAEAVVIEIQNDSKVPFAVALAVRPHGQVAVGRIDEVSLAGTQLSIDGTLALALPRSPGRMVLSDGATDAADVVMAGDAEPVSAAAARSDDGLGNAALLFPLAHTATLRVLIPLGETADLGDPDTFPSASDVASGWTTQAGQGWRIELPDRRLRDAAAASVRHLLLARPSVAAAAALDLAGFPDEAARHLVGNKLDLAGSDHPGAVLAAVARHWDLTHDATFAAAAVDLVGALVPRLGRQRDAHDRAVGEAAFASAAALLAAAGEEVAATDLAALAPPASDGAALRPVPAAELKDLLGSATGVWTWPGTGTGHDPLANARLVEAVRAHLVGDDGTGLALAPIVPDTWLGQGWEVHDAPTRHGLLSYAVRWHGERPAVLWQLDRHEGSGPVTISAPGLDPGWSSAEAEGEALLSPVALPAKEPRRGISMPVTIESAPRRRDA